MKKTRLLIPFLLTGLLLTLFFSMAIQSAQAQDIPPDNPSPPHREPVPTQSPEKSDLSRFSPNAISAISSNFLGTGNNQVHGLIYYDGYLWASTRTSPARVLKIDPSTLITDSQVILSSGENYGEDIVAANGFIWVILYTSPARLIRVDPSTMLSSTIQLTGLRDGEALEYAFDYLWAGGRDSLAQIDISSPLAPTYQIHDYSSLATQNLFILSALTSSENHLWGTLTHWSWVTGWVSTTVIKINPGNPSGSYTTTGVSTLFPDDMVFTNNHLYISNEENGSNPSDVYQFKNDLSTYTTTRAADSSSYGTFLNPLDPEHFWGAYIGSPGKIIKFDLEVSATLTLTLPTGYNDPSEIAFDQAGNMYVSTWQSPAGIVKYTVPLSITDLTIHRVSSSAVLTWTHSETDVTHYQVWRSSDPYFTPGDTGSSIISNTIPVASTGTGTYTDTGAIGDTGTNYYYVVKAVNSYGLVSPISNRVGEFDFELRETTGTDYTWIALPLNNSSNTMASALADHIEANSDGSVSVQTISRWNATAQSPVIYYHQFNFGDFSIQNQHPYRLEIDIGSGESLVWTYTGDVPDIGSYSCTLRETTGTDYTWIMHPLHLSNITMSSGIANDIETNASASVTIQTISRWNAIAQSPVIYYHQFNFGDFTSRPGYPYRVEVDITSGDSVTWP